MSKINQIERALSEIDSAKFHKLVNTYLSKAYSYNITSSGTKIGEDKSQKGTPDSHAILDNKKYVFIECTTQKSGVKKKFLEDIEKCLDQEKTDIQKKIDKIILACNTDLKLNEVENLKNRCDSKGIECEVFGISAISIALFGEYPSIAQEFLNISIDTQQILDHDDFIKNYNAHKYSTPLHAETLLREEEKKDLYQKIEESPVILITGTPGVGKTQLALEVGSKYARDKEYEFKAILNRGTNISNDMISYFKKGNEKYLMFIDDVNRITKALDYALNYLNIQDGSLKIIATVRDYAKGKIIQTLPKKIHFIDFNLEHLKEEEIKEIVKKEYGIYNSLYLERITNIANGNPRLAIMASMVAKEKDTLESIYDVSALYDEYFSNIRNDLDDSYLLAIAIVAFFRSVDKNNHEQNQIIKDTFEISIEKLWQSISKIHELEIFDLYENEVVKISDQILSTYLFYKIVFVDKKIKISLFLKNLFPRYQQRLVDILNPILNTFDNQLVVTVLEKPVDELWKRNANDETYLYALMDTFWYFKQTDILVYFQEKIKNLESEAIQTNELNFWEESNTNHIKDGILNQLSILKHDSQDVKTTIELILMYFKKKPSIFLDAIRVLTGNYVYNYNSDLDGYSKEYSLFNTTWGYCNNDKNESLTKLFIRVCSELLRNEGRALTSKGKVVTIQNFKVVATNELKNIRKDIFDKLSILYKKRICQPDILKLIHKYPSHLGHMFGISEIEHSDADNILKFISDNFRTSCYEEVSAVHRILNFLERKKISFDNKLRERFHHELYELEKIMTLNDVSISLDSPSDKEEKTDWDKIREIKKEKLSQYVESYEFSDWEQLIDNCKLIIEKKETDTRKFSYNFEELLKILAKKDAVLYRQVFEKYLELGNTLNLYLCTRDSIDILGKEKSLELLKKYSYHLKDHWLFNYYQNLQKEEINNSEVQELLGLYKTSAVFVPYDLNYLERYSDIEPKIFILVVKILTNRCINEDKSFYLGFEILFNRFNRTLLKIEEYFDNDIELIKNCYLLCMNNGQGFDYDSTGLYKILDYDISFLSDYLDKIFEGKNYLSSHDINHQFDVLWQREDYENIFFNLVETLFLKRNKKVFSRRNVLQSFLSVNTNTKEFEEKTNTLIKGYIDKFFQCDARMKFLFEYIGELSYERRKELILHFLQKNKSFELFNQLNFKPSSSICSGSRVPYLKKDIDFYTSLLKNIDGLDFLKHRGEIEERIKYIKENIEKEKKDDFMRDF